MGCAASSKAPERDELIEKKPTAPHRSPAGVSFKLQADDVHAESSNPAQIYGAELTDNVAEAGDPAQAQPGFSSNTGGGALCGQTQPMPGGPGDYTLPGHGQQPPPQDHSQQPPPQGFSQQALSQGYSQQPPQQHGFSQQPPQQQGFSQQPPQQQGFSQQPPQQQGFSQQAPPQGFSQQPPPQGYSQQPPSQGYSQQPPTQGYSQQPPPQDYSQQPPPQGYSQQAPPQGSGSDPSPSHVQVVNDSLTLEILNEFIELDKEIQELETNHTEEMLTLHQTEYGNIEQALKERQSELTELEKNVVSEEDGMLNCSLYMQRNHLSIIPEGNEQPQEEVLEIKKTLEVVEAKNKQEVCEKQLVALQDKLHEISEAVETSLQQVDKLTRKRLRLNGLLENVFNGEYGSDLENRLEFETEQLLQYKQHVSVAHFKWWNGRYLINHALTQMAIVCKKWKDVQQCSRDNEVGRYALATTARNNLVAVQQNCLRAEEYLKMDMPYWTSQEKQYILASINALYADLTSSYAFEKAYSWFYYYHQRLGLQLNWMDQVINNKIVTDYQRVSEEFKVKYRELRMERLKLIQEKVKELLDVDWDIEPFMSSSTENDEMDSLPMVPMVDANTPLNEDASTDSGDTEVVLPKPSEEALINNDNIPVSPTHEFETTGGDVSGPPPVRRLSLTQLAPTPSDSELFGNVKQLEMTHRRQMEAFDKVQDVNRAKQEQGLKDKLRERQSKRRKQMLQQVQETVLSDTSTTSTK